MADVLSQWIVVGRCCGSPNSCTRRRSQITSEVAAERDRYSTSVEDLAMVTCFLTVQETRFGPRKVQNPEMDLRSELSEAQSASVYVARVAGCDGETVGFGTLNVLKQSFESLEVLCCRTVHVLAYLIRGECNIRASD
ncbi:hypothetical protein KFK09_015597 [Dendrobium nobile]|uniref:Uncharacterized protein n=1 Tax=Dendrobium nobile TaxID=94219 RepID=A0A8T3B6N1_DENNO|nr:hypothetical protein KFK09_015597 [Dendrobium nobile]